jgi:hypothetical protein
MPIMAGDMVAGVTAVITVMVAITATAATTVMDTQVITADTTVDDRQFGLMLPVIKRLNLLQVWSDWTLCKRLFLAILGLNIGVF